MEVVAQTDDRLELFLSRREYFALLRPGGMLAELDSGADGGLEVERLSEGAVLVVNRNRAAAIVGAGPEHFCDDVLRLEIAEWLRRLRSEPASFLTGEKILTENS